MIVHPDGRLEGTPEELIAYQRRLQPVQTQPMQPTYPDRYKLPGTADPLGLDFTNITCDSQIYSGRGDIGAWDGPPLRYVRINGRRFFYDPADIQLNQTILGELVKFDGPDEAYSFYMDESQGLVIY